MAKYTEEDMELIVSQAVEKAAGDATKRTNLEWMEKGQRGSGGGSGGFSSGSGSDEATKLFAPGVAFPEYEKEMTSRLTKFASKKGGVDAYEELGGGRKDDAFRMRVLALSQPQRYAAIRLNAMDDVKKAVSESFQTAYDANIAAGYAHDKAKEEALKVAKVTMESQERAMKVRFPDADTAVYVGKTARNANAFV